MIIFLSLIISLILMPFVVKDKHWLVRGLYLMLCILLTPIIGIPLFEIFDKM